MDDQEKESPNAGDKEKQTDAGKENAQSKQKSDMSKQSIERLEDLVKDEVSVELPFSLTSIENFLFLFGNMYSRVKQLEESVTKIEVELKNVSGRLDSTDKSLNEIRIELVDINRRQDETNRRLDETNRRQDETNKELGKLETRLDQKIENALNRQRIWLIGCMVVMTGLIISAIGIL